MRRDSQVGELEALERMLECLWVPSLHKEILPSAHLGRYVPYSLSTQNGFEFFSHLKSLNSKTLIGSLLWGQGRWEVGSGLELGCTTGICPGRRWQSKSLLVDRIWLVCRRLCMRLLKSCPRRQPVGIGRKSWKHWWICKDWEEVPCQPWPVQFSSLQFSPVQLLSRVRLFTTPWVTARQASLSITNS